MPIILHCRACLEGFRHFGGEKPEKCPRCGFVHDDLWLTRDELPEPLVPYELTRMDRKFLRSVRIEA